MYNPHGSEPEPAPAAGNEAKPESIEDQINTSITQTLKALDMDKAKAAMDEAEEEEEEKPKKSGGLFSRFRKSS